MSKIQLTDSTMDVVMKMSDGNPGAVGAIMDLMENNAKIDPQSALGPLGTILALDTMGIYGTDIYILWSDKCGKDARKMIMLMRASQLGLIGEERIQAMAGDQMRSIDLTIEEYADLDKKVCEQLPEFQKPVVTDEEVIEEDNPEFE